MDVTNKCIIPWVSNYIRLNWLDLAIRRSNNQKELHVSIHIYLEGSCLTGSSILNICLLFKAYYCLCMYVFIYLFEPFMWAVNAMRLITLKSHDKHPHILTTLQAKLEHVPPQTPLWHQKQYITWKPLFVFVCNSYK